MDFISERLARREVKKITAIKVKRGNKNDTMNGTNPT
jgi:hypothetical protein